jgi:hypothetical protein
VARAAAHIDRRGAPRARARIASARRRERETFDRSIASERASSVVGVVERVRTLAA